MSIWDSVKPAKKVPVATAVDLSADAKALALRWNDGVASTVTARTLRQYCPCAECVEEWSGRRTFDVATISAEMKIVELTAVGNYALTFTFGDMHRTGIFNWETLRQLSTQPPSDE